MPTKTLLKKQKAIVKMTSAEKESMLLKMATNCNPYQRKNIVASGFKQYEERLKSNKGEVGQKDPAYQMLTLYEFDHALLLAGGFQESLRTLATDLSAKFQKEYNCETPSEKATAHLVAQNYVRTFELQRHINVELNRDYYTDMTIRRLAILEKSYDRANRQYLLSIQELRTAKLPPLNVKLVTQNAMFGQYQQVVNKTEQEETVVDGNNNAK
jgi:hypothetical protein